MADLELVREEGDGVQTVITVRVTEYAWEGTEQVVHIVGHHVHVPEACILEAS